MGTTARAVVLPAGPGPLWLEDVVLPDSGRHQVVAKPHSVYLAEHIPGARLVEPPGEDILSLVGDTEAVVGEIEEFLTRRSPPT
jgi:hypothetical protein